MEMSSKIAEIKKQLKRWEKAFQEAHDRKASSEDIKLAPQRIQDAYKEYSRLKRGLDETPKKSDNVAGNIASGAWGTHLNRSNCNDPTETTTETQHNQGQILHRYSRKLQQEAGASKFPKTLSSKRPTSGPKHAVREKNGINDDAEDDDCDIRSDVMQHPRSIFTCLTNDRITLTSSSSKVKTPQNDVIAGSLYSKPKKRSWKADWLENCKLDLPSDENKMGMESPETVTQQEQILDADDINLIQEKRKNLPANQCDRETGRTTPICSANSLHVELGKDKKNGHSNTKSTNLLHSPHSEMQHPSGCVKANANSEQCLDENASVTNSQDCLIQIAPQISLETVAMKTIKVVSGCQDDATSGATDLPSQQPSSTSMENPKRQSKRKLEDDQEIIPVSTAKKPKREGPTLPLDTEIVKIRDEGGISCPGRGRLDSQTRQEMIDVKENSQSISNRKGISNSKDKKTTSTSSRSSSAAAPTRSNLNDNFVKLEMKKKRYTRKGLFHIKGEAYKRQVWKQKMQMQGRGGLAGASKRWRGGWKGNTNLANPTDKCFKCGQTGHWASRCTGYQQSETKISEVKEEDFPTLEEAALAARGIKTTPGEGEDSGEAHVEFIPEVSIDTVYDFPAPPPPIQPLLQLESNGHPVATPPSVYGALQQMGYSSFRPGQEQAVMRILSGLSTLVVLSTGAGKSLVYQLASLMYSQRGPCITLVISPLVSLMDDQVLGLPDCLTGVRLHSNMTKPQREKVIKEIQAGHVNILLVSPEAIVGGSGTGGGCMPALAQLPPIAFVCIDEVHCLSEWSHNFRPSYLMLCKVLRDRLGVQCMLGLTATATMATAESVAQHLGIAGDPQAIIRGTCLPDNLQLSSSRDNNRERALVELLNSERFCHLPSIIIYCIRREDTERVASLLRTCLPDEELQVTPAMDDKVELVANQDVAKDPKADVISETIVIRCQTDTKEDMSGISDQEAEVTVKTDEATTCSIGRDGNLDPAASPVDQLHDDVSSGRRDKKKSTKQRKSRSKGSCNSDRVAKTTRKRKTKVSKTGDDAYSFSDEEAESNGGKKKKTTKTKKQTKRAKSTAGMKKKVGLGSKSAGKGVRVVTGVNSVEAYHAGMTPAARRRAQTAFMTGRLRIVVATVAFGMGLDKSDVRAVLHFNLPKSFESYVQEIGRAGRDQKPAHCHVFLEPQGKDLCELRRHTYANTVDRYSIKKLVCKLFPSCKCHQARRLYQMSSDSIPDATGSTMPDNAAEISDEQALAALEDYEQSLGVTSSDSAIRRTGRQSLGKKLCRGHLVAVPIESTVQELDIKEEGISTLLCYLELHPKRWLVGLPPTYSTCTIQCYGGPAQLQQLAKSCPPVAVAIAKNKQRGKTYRHASSVEFDVVEVARCMGWDLTIIKKELRQLQWRQVLGKGWVKSGVIVEFSNLAFLMLTPGDLTDEEQDEIVEFLTSKSHRQERRELNQIQAVHTALHSISHANYWECSYEVDIELSNSLKAILKEYFARSIRSLEADSEQLDESQNGEQAEMMAKASRVRGDVRHFLSLHTDRTFSGRAIARIFHGVASPCYPAQVWGRDRRFWRAHLDFDFNKLLEIATEEIIRLR